MPNHPRPRSTADDDSEMFDLAPVAQEPGWLLAEDAEPVQGPLRPELLDHPDP